MLDTAEGDEVADVGDEARFDFLDVLNFRIGDSFYYVQVLNMGGAADDLVARRVRRVGEAVDRDARLTPDTDADACEVARVSVCGASSTDR